MNHTTQPRLDLECWENKLGIIRGALLAFHAPEEVLAALDWIHGKVEPLDATPAMPPSAPSAAEDAAMLRFISPMDDRTKSIAEMVRETTVNCKSRRHAWTEEEEAKMIRLINEGANIPSMADHFPNRSYSSLYSLVQRLKAEGRTR